MAAETPADPTVEDLADSAIGHQSASAPPATGADRREHPRLRPEELTDLAARLASGAEIRLIDLSRSGAQFETDRRFLPNSTISLRLVTRDATFVANGRVVRSRIVRLEKGGLGYNVAVAFNEVLQNAIEARTPPPEPEPVALSQTTEVVATRAEEPVAQEVPDATTDLSLEETDEVTTEERAAFEAMTPVADGPSMLTVTASVEQTGEELRNMFNGNAW